MVSLQKEERKKEGDQDLSRKRERMEGMEGGREVLLFLFKL